MSIDYLIVGEVKTKYIYSKRKTVFKKSKERSSKIDEFVKKLTGLGFSYMDSSRRFEERLFTDTHVLKESYKESNMYTLHDSDICVIVSDIPTYFHSLWGFSPEKSSFISNLVVEVAKLNSTENKNSDRGKGKPKSVICQIKEKLMSYFQHRANYAVDSTKLLEQELEQKINTLACNVFDRPYKIKT